MVWGWRCSALMQEGRTWSYPNLLCQNLLTSHGSPYLLGGVDVGGQSGGTESGVEKAGELWMK